MATVTDTRKKELRDWAYRVWNLHWRELAPKSNSRAQFLKYVLRDNLPDEELKRVELAIQAQAKHWRKQNKIERVVGIPTLSVWYNQQRYDDEFIDESSMDMVEREALKKCSVQGCNEEVHGSSFDKCAFHIPNNHDEMLRESWTRTGITKDSPTFIDDCRKYCRERMNVLMGKI